MTIRSLVRVSGWGSSGSVDLLGVSGKKGERRQSLTGFPGRQVVAVLRLWSYSITYHLWSSLMEVYINAFRGGNGNFSSSAELAALWLLQSVFKTKSKTFLCNIGQLFPPFYCSLLHSLPFHPRQVRPLPPIPPLNQTQGGGNPKVK